MIGRPKRTHRAFVVAMSSFWRFLTLSRSFCAATGYIEADGEKGYYATRGESYLVEHVMLHVVNSETAHRSPSAMTGKNTNLAMDAAT